MKKSTWWLMLSLAVVLILSSCADSKTFIDNSGNEFTVEPYGWADRDILKNDTIQYRVVVGNVVWSVLTLETIAIPVWLTGWDLYEPVNVKPEYVKHNR